MHDNVQLTTKPHAGVLLESAHLKKTLAPGGNRLLLWEPTLSAMGACLDLIRCRGIADKVGSHQVASILPLPPARAAIGARDSPRRPHW
jgi:hypothetical protein